MTKSEKYLRSVISYLDRTSKEYDEKRDIAIANKMYSQVSGFDGISIGLLKASKLISDEMMASKRNKQLRTLKI